MDWIWLNMNEYHCFEWNMDQLVWTEYELNSMWMDMIKYDLSMNDLIH